MTRHTPDFLRARTSNLSMRSSMAADASFQARVEPVAEASASRPYLSAKDIKPEAFTKPYTDFMTENPTIFHATAYFKEQLLTAGYTEVSHFSCDSLPV